ncbi:8594_t:CDS:2 [Diversispora eburnea]|uniref:8594_t:CDS:1 n=1 Tax=Diversispora eburnea TaxID=1213867 RepID=A0A9N8YM23_9GLOM|nr:8594_t:CDS:2 [Diversispora eburnea]
MRNASPKTGITSNKSSETTAKAPTLQIIPHDEIISLFEQRKGAQYFIPEGFEPVLIPSNSSLPNLLQNDKGVQQQLLAHHKQLKLINQNIFPSLVLARPSAPTPRGGIVTKAVKPKKPPRPPNAFILYRRSKQPGIVAANEGITNNEVSKQVGEMWHKEPLEEKMRFQRMADEAKLQHMEKYPEYKYRPRRPHEKRRRNKRQNTGLGNSNVMPNNNNTTINNKPTTSVINNTSSPLISSSPIISNVNINNINELLLLDRRASVDTIDTISTSDYVDESRRNSLLSINEQFEEFELPIFENTVSPIIDDNCQYQFQPSTTPPSSSESPDTYNDYNNVCVETTGTNSLDLFMEGVSPGSESEVNPFDYFFTPPNEPYNFIPFGEFDLSNLMSSPNIGIEMVANME